MDLDRELTDALKAENIDSVPDEVLLGKIRQTIKERCTDGGLECRRNRIGFRWKVVAALVCAAILAGAYHQIPEVKMFARGIAEYFRSSVFFVNGTSEEAYQYNDLYVVLSEDAPKVDQLFCSITEVEQETGVNFLQAKDATEGYPCFGYTPYVSENGTLNGFMLINDYYVMGDLQNVSIKEKKGSDDVRCEYEIGEQYKSPVTMQATVRSKESEGVDYDNHELEYSGTTFDLSNPDVTDVNLYPMEKLGIKAVIATIGSDGRMGYCLSDYETTSVSVAFFVYHGVEYIYIGDIAQDVMKKFLDGLEE